MGLKYAEGRNAGIVAIVASIFAIISAIFYIRQMIDKIGIIQSELAVGMDEFNAMQAFGPLF
jgi:hypothetical protein